MIIPYKSYKNVNTRSWDVLLTRISDDWVWEERTCAQISSGSARFSLQQHALWGHLGVKRSLYIVHECFTVGAIHPDSLAKRVLNVDLRGKKKKKHTHINIKHFFIRKEGWLLLASYFDKDLRPVLILFVRCHQQIAGQNRHQAVPLCLKVDRGITPKEAAQSLSEDTGQNEQVERQKS